jgi:glycosyltransferase involved in cell wall biosynthesis
MATAIMSGDSATTRHAFVVPAYGRSVHLEDCLASLASQTRPSPIVVCTSTPYEGLEAVCSRFGARLVCHGPNRGIAHDWNAALDEADAEWVTIAHQDDVYLPGFAERTLALAERYPRAVLVFTEYEEVDDKGVRPRSLLLRIKRILVEFGMLGFRHVSSRWAKTNLLRFGCSIGCPTVTLRLPALPSGMRFSERYRVNLDWDFWLRLARDVDGGFACDRQVLMRHRIHGESETTTGIVEGIRFREDLELFGRVWPAPVANAITRAYALSYRFNRS